MTLFAVAALLCAAELSLTDYSDAVRSEVERQVKSVFENRGEDDRLSGVVSLVSDGCFFLQGEHDAIKVVYDGSSPPEPGARVLVTGGPSLEGGRVVFVAHKFAVEGRGELPDPIKADGRDLVFVSMGREGREIDVNWRRVEVKGRAIGLTEAGFAMEIDDIPVTIFSSGLPDFLGDCGRTHPLVRVTGVPELVLDQSSLFGRPRRVMGVKLHVASRDDIELLPDLRYQLNRRDARVQVAVVSTIACLGMVLVMLVVFLVRQARHHLRTRTLMIERKRMADDLHDTIEQHLVGAGMLLQLGKSKEAREVLVRAKREMRDIVWGLKNDDMMRLTPAEMIREFVKAENKKGVCRLDAILQGLPERMDASQMRDLSLILREAVGNAVKHGGAGKIAISSEPVEGGGWLMRIANDGIAYDPATAPGPDEGHFGLEGMKARAMRLGATLEMGVRGAWTVVSLCKRG
jgi:signal transduction histidine kinase